MSAENKKYRLNLYEQMTEYRKLVFAQEIDLFYYHTLLYDFLLIQNYRANWSEWIKIPLDIALIGTQLSKTTYYKAIEGLEKAGLIEYQPGKNQMRAAKFHINSLPIKRKPDGKADRKAGIPPGIPPGIPAGVPQKDPLYNNKSIIDNTKSIIKKNTQKKEVSEGGDFLKTKKEKNNKTEIDNLWEDYCELRRRKGRGFINVRQEKNSYEELAKMAGYEDKQIIEILKYTTGRGHILFEKPKLK